MADARTVADRWPGVARRWSVLVAGYLVMGVGVGLMLRAERGLATVDVITDAFLRRGLPAGVAVALAFALVATVGMLLRVRPTAATGFGLLVPAVAAHLTVHHVGVEGYLPLVLGAAVTGIGVGLYLHAELGAAPGDLVYLGLLRRGLPAGWSKVGFDASATALGWSLGGSVTWGTLAVIVTIGPTVAMTRSLLAGRSTR